MTTILPFSPVEIIRYQVYLVVIFCSFLSSDFVILFTPLLPRSLFPDLSNQEFAILLLQHYRAAYSQTFPIKNSQSCCDTGVLMIFQKQARFMCPNYLLNEIFTHQDEQRTTQDWVPLFLNLKCERSSNFNLLYKFNNTIEKQKQQMCIH
jgi:hypothetical protein